MDDDGHFEDAVRYLTISTPMKRNHPLYERFLYERGEISEYWRQCIERYPGERGEVTHREGNVTHVRFKTVE